MKEGESEGRLKERGKFQMIIEEKYVIRNRRREMKKKIWYKEGSVRKRRTNRK